MADDDRPPEDWEELGWCCEDCAVTAWYGMSPEVRRWLLAAGLAGNATRYGARRDT